MKPSRDVSISEGSPVNVRRPNDSIRFGAPKKGPAAIDLFIMREVKRPAFR